MFPRKLRIEIGLAVGLKLVALVLVYYFLVVPTTKPPPDRESVRVHLLGQPN